MLCFHVLFFLIYFIPWDQVYHWGAAVRRETTFLVSSCNCNSMVLDNTMHWLFVQTVGLA